MHACTMYYSRLFIANVVFLSLVKCGITSTPPKVTLSHGGSLLGIILTTDYGRMVDSFLGIPYARPPINELRFAAPQPAEPWSGEKSADNDTPACLQYLIFTPGPDKTTGSEDCLNLNVYTPHDRPIGKKMPVLLWFHGGAFKLGSVFSNNAGPQRLLDNDIVLVTCTYRLAALGFLSTGTLDSPGNYGLKDQNMALKWILKNIEFFGGDPHKITLAGQSAGGASVGFHMASPLSEGLFQKAILQSGNSFDGWALVDSDVAIERTKKLANLFNCTIDNFQEMLVCLRLIPGKDIAGSAPAFVEFVSGDPLTVFAPTVEPDSPGAFLPKNPRQLKDTYGHRITIIIGVTSDDGHMKTASLIYNFNEELSNNFENVLQLLIGYENIPLQDQIKVTQKLDQFYLKGERGWTSENHQNLTNLVSDGVFFSGLDRFIRNRFAAKVVGSTYVYVFDYRGPEPLTEFLGGGPDYYGVAHIDELPFLMNLNQVNVTRTVRDRRMRYAMSKMWADFMWAGNPTPRKSNVTEKWKRTIQYPLKYAKIGNQCRFGDEANQDTSEESSIDCSDVSGNTSERESEEESTIQACSDNYLIITNKIGFFEKRMKLWRSLLCYLQWI